MDLLYFVILVSALIFVHELGHFTVAKVFGIKVLTFSVGFGPKILRLRGKETEYCVGLIPLGGFVRMLEESRGEPVLPEDRRRTFEAQAIWKRLLVVLAGPVMNLIFPVLLYFFVFASEQRFVPPTVGVVLPGHPAEGKLIEGDRILSVDGREVGTFVELQQAIAQNPGRELKLRVFRSMSYVEVEVTPEEVIEGTGFERTAPVGRLGILPHAPAPCVGISNPESPAYRAGLRTFDVLTSVGGRPVKLFSDVAKIIDDNRGETVPVTFLRPKFLDGALGGFADLGVYEAGVAALTPEQKQGDLYSRTGIESSDLYVAIVPPGSAQAKANIQRGDRIWMLDQERVPSWSVLLERLFAEKEKPHKITYIRDGREDAGTVQLRHEWYVDESGQPHERYAVRMDHWAPTVPEPLVEHPHLYAYAARNAVEKTLDVARFLVTGMVQMAEGKISLSQLSGPIAIYEVAGREGAKGTDYFLWVMAVISINLGLLNLMPIPVLDGGHLLFLASEALLRRPLPIRVREVASLVGMLFLMSLMGIAFKNDVERRWDVIAGQLKELFGLAMASRAPDARRVAAEVVRRVLREGAFASAALSSELDAAAQLEPRDRAFATELVYGTLRAARYLEGELGKLAPKGLSGLDDLALAHLLIGAYQIAFLGGVPARAAVSEAVSAVKDARGARLSGFVNAVLRKASVSLVPGGITATDAFVKGSPRWLKRALDRALGPGEGDLFLAAGPVPAPLSLRVRRGDRGAWAARLGEALPSATITPGKASPSCLLVSGGGDPRAWPGVASGEIVLQEEGSQVVAAFLGATAGERVLDACAGRGNKTLYLADQVGPEGRVDSADLHGQKLERLSIEAERVGAHVGSRFEVDWSRGTGDAPLSAYDRVLVDAPCTGVGTLRRRPEILLRRTEADLAELSALQKAIVQSASQTVKPGGTLVFAVCSVLREELEEVVADLPGFSLQETKRLAPHRDGTDGYAMARLVRG